MANWELSHFSLASPNPFSKCIRAAVKHSDCKRHIKTFIYTSMIKINIIEYCRHKVKSDPLGVQKLVADVGVGLTVRVVGTWIANKCLGWAVPQNT